MRKCFCVSFVGTFLSLSSSVFAEVPKQETIELTTRFDLMVCDDSADNSKQCSPSIGAPKVIGIVMTCESSTSGTLCAGDWDTTIERDGFIFQASINANKEVDATGIAQYTISATSRFIEERKFFNTIYLGRENQLTDRIGLM